MTCISLSVTEEIFMQTDRKLLLSEGGAHMESPGKNGLFLVSATKTECKQGAGHPIHPTPCEICHPHLSLTSSSWHLCCFKSYSISLKNRTFHILTLLKLGCIFQMMKNGHRVGPHIVSETLADFSVTAAGMVEWHPPFKFSLKGLLKGHLTNGISDTVVWTLSAGPCDQIKEPSAGKT